MGLLLVDMLNNIVQEVIVLSDSDPQHRALASVIMFLVIILLSFIPLVIGHFIYLCLYRRHYISFISSFIQTLGLLFYFYGSNVTTIINNYSSELGCDTQCVLNNEIAASILLGASLFIFQVIPSMMLKLTKLLKKKGNKQLKKKRTPDWYAVMDMITRFVKINTVYASIVSRTQSVNDFCSTAEIAGSSSFLVICVILGMANEFVDFFYAIESNKNQKNKLFYGWATTGVLLTAFLSLPLYLLSDNLQPLDCAFACDTYLSNSTLDDSLCNQGANSATRLGFNAVSLIIVAVISCAYFYNVMKLKITGTQHTVKRNITVEEIILEGTFTEVEEVVVGGTTSTKT